MAQKELDAVLVSQPENRRYLSGFTGSAGYLLISHDKAILGTDFRYVEQAGVEAPDFEIVKAKGAVSKWLPSLASDLHIRKLGFEAAEMAFATYRDLSGALGKNGSQMTLVATEGIVDSLRAVKSEEELKALEEAAALADAALEHVLSRVRPGVTEKRLAWDLESFVRQNGSDPLPFDIIVASGPNGAMPHAKPTDRAIPSNEPVVIDLGARVRGYCSDMTRTICLGAGDSTLRRIYDIVLGAQLTAMATVRAGMTGDQADQLGRTVIAQAGYEESFGHGLGHGIGLAAHEEPRLGSGSSTLLMDGMVFTIEPGIYISGWGGVRIEDTVVLERGGARALTKSGKVRSR